MTFLTRSAVLTLTLVGMASPIAAVGEQQTSAEQGPRQSSRPRSCAAKAAGDYGFQCHGSSAPAGILEPVTFIGMVTGTEDGFYEGAGTFNSSAGSLTIHVAGQATFGHSCFGHVDYNTHEIRLPGGAVVPLPPISFDFIAVDGGNEILGTGVANPASAIGDFVPRVTCRLVRTGR